LNITNTPHPTQQKLEFLNADTEKMGRRPGRTAAKNAAAALSKFARSAATGALKQLLTTLPQKTPHRPSMMVRMSKCRM
jgi:hypothetical protein